MRRLFRLPATRRSLAREVDDEIAFHLDQRIADLVASGHQPAAAREQAEREYGDLAASRRELAEVDQRRFRRAQHSAWWDAVRLDLRYALRGLRRRPLFTALIVGALAVGIGANTAIFTLVDAVLVRSLPVLHPEQLVAVGDAENVNSIGNGSPRTELLSAPLFRTVRDQNRVFSGVLASGPTQRLDVRFNSGDGEPEHPHGRFVSGNYFAVLGVRAYAGRTFDASADSVRGGAPVVTISYGYWRTRLHGDRAAIGQTMLIDDVRCTIVGVTAPSFTGEIIGESADVWIPLEMRDAMRPNDRVLDDRTASWLLLIGRLAPGVTIERARREIVPLVDRDILATASARDAAAFLRRAHAVQLSPAAKGLSTVRKDFGAPLLTLMIGAALLLAIICANVANLLLARTLARSREIAVRLAIGADRSRLVRQLLTESGLLALLSAALGLLLAWNASRWLLVMAADGDPLALDVSMDTRALVFTLVTSLLAVALFGLAPALRASRVDLIASLRASASAASVFGRARRAFGSALVVGQVALSLVLVVGAALLARSLYNVQTTDVGYDRDHLVIVDLDIRSRAYAGARLATTVHLVRDGLAALPGVTAVSYSENGIFSGTDWHSTIHVPGFSSSVPDDSSVATDMAGPGYAHAIGAPIVDGRDLEARDEHSGAPVAIVNQAMARFYFRRRSAVGQFVRIHDSVAVRIVGVIGDARDHDLTEAAQRRMYLPYAQTGASATLLGAPEALRLEVRTSGNPASLVQAIRAKVLAVEPSLPIDGVRPLGTLMHQSIRQERLVARLATTLGALALVLAGIGLYGVITYAVVSRTGELGVRIALGATRQRIVALVLGDALRLTLAGLALGAPLSLALARLLQSQLHGLGAFDPVSVVLAFTVLATSAGIAAVVPALRASRLSPLSAMRDS